MAHILGRFSAPFIVRPTAVSASASASSNNQSSLSYGLDATFIKRAAELADKSAGFTAPHPNFGCVIAATDGGRGAAAAAVGEGYLYAEGTTAAEVQAVEAAGELCRGATAYLNMEPGDSGSDTTAVSALIQVALNAHLIFSLFHFCYIFPQMGGFFLSPSMFRDFL